MLSIQIWLYQVFKIVLLFLFLFITVFLAENKLDGCMQVEKKKKPSFLLHQKVPFRILL